MEWKTEQLGNLITIKYGKDHKKLKDGPFPVYGSGGIMRFVDTAIYNKPSLLLPRKGSLNNIMFTDKPFWTVDTMFWSIIDESKIEPKFLYYAMCKKNLVALNVGTSVPSLTVPVLEDVSIPYPPIPIQRKIAGILSALDSKIENNNKINANLEAQAEALFKSWFVDFTPFKDQPFVDSELGSIPQGWKVGKLGDLGDIICGKTPSKKNKNFYGGNIPFIKIPDLHGHVFVNESADSLTNTGSLSQKNKLLPSHSLMVSCIATVGLVSINSKPAHTNQQINSIIPICDYLLYFLYLFIKRNKDYLQNLGRGGTTTLNVNTKTFSSILIAIPQKDVVINFHQIVSPIFKTIENNIQENQRLAALRDTLLPKLMSGEIKL
ncbi:MAG: restriction endonuclease subunit S [Bacteroidales bacterium]|nr:restriction endonuclease subunit S [Bacteroidales bacterium]